MKSAIYWISLFLFLSGCENANVAISGVHNASLTGLTTSSSSSTSSGAPIAPIGNAVNPAPLAASYLADLNTISSRQANQQFPRLAINTSVMTTGSGSDQYLGQAVFDRLHWFDVALVNSSVADKNNQFSPFFSYLGTGGILRTRNPNIILLARFSLGDFINDPYVSDSQPGINNNPVLTTFAWGNYDLVNHVIVGNDLFSPAWLFHDTHGNLITNHQLSDGNYSYIPDPNNTGYQNRVIRVLNNLVISSQAVDGIMHNYGAYSIIPNAASTQITNNGISLLNNGNNSISNLTSLSDPVNLEWQNGLIGLYKSETQSFPANFLIVGDAGTGSVQVNSSYYNYLSGAGLSDFTSCINDASCGWAKLMYTYASACLSPGAPNNICGLSDSLTAPQINTNNLVMDQMIATNNQWISTTQAEQLRFALGSSLLFNGYFSVNNNNPNLSSRAVIWLDEYSVDATGNSVFPTDSSGANMMASKGWLGKPLGDAYSVTNSSITLWSLLNQYKITNISNYYVWRRDFTNGTVLVNPTAYTQIIYLSGTHHYINGKIDPNTNNGNLVGPYLYIPSNSAIILKNN